MTEHQAGILFAPNGLQSLEEGALETARLVVVSQPVGEEAASHIDPDFVLTSASIVGDEILLVYSRAAFVPRLAELEREVQLLSARADASAAEAAGLRRLTAGLLSSWSWKVTAPLRWVSRPFLKDASQEPSPAPPTAFPLLAELQKARSLVVIPCAVPFRSSFNQRPISMARYFADRGATVLYVVLESAEP